MKGENSEIRQEREGVARKESCKKKSRKEKETETETEKNEK